MPHWAAWSLPLTSTATPNLMHGIHAHRVSLISWSIWLSTRQRCAGWAGAVDGCSEWMGAGDVWVQWIGAHFFLAASCMAQKSAAQSVPISHVLVSILPLAEVQQPPDRQLSRAYRGGVWGVPGALVAEWGRSWGLARCASGRSSGRARCASGWILGRDRCIGVEFGA